MESLKSHSILFVITGLHPGGAEAQLALVAHELLRRGWNPKVVSMTSGGHLQARFENLGLPVVTLNMRRGIPDPRGLARLVRMLRHDRPAILHTHMVHANLLGRVASIFASVPVVISTTHSITEGGRSRELAYRMTDRLADLTTIVSNAAAERYIRVGAVPARKLKTVPNGVSVNAYGPCAKTYTNLRIDLGLADQFVWLAVGRFDTPKDYPNLLTAMSRLKNQNHALLIAGDGPLRGTTEKLAAELGIAERVQFLGTRKDIPQLMAAADAYVMSSAWEGLPMVLLEASASGLPIVATAVGGNHEVVREGISGTLVPAGDSTALADAMRRIEELSVDARRSMGLAGRDHVERHYSLSSVVSQWEQIYNSLIQRKLPHAAHEESLLNA